MPTLRVVLAALCIISSCIAQSTFAQQVLFVTGDAPLSSADRTVKGDLEAIGMQLHVVRDAASATSDADGKDLVLISESVLPARVGNKFSRISVPLVVYESHLYDELGMSSSRGGSYGNVFFQRSLFVQGTHPLTGGLGGTVQVSTKFGNLSWAKPGSEAIVAATLRGDRQLATIFGYEAGTTLADGQTAPARRVGLFPNAGSIDSRTPASRDLFLAAVRWALARAEDDVQFASVESVNESIERIEPIERNERNERISTIPAEPEDLPVVEESLQQPGGNPVADDPILSAADPTNEEPTGAVVAREILPIVEEPLQESQINPVAADPTPAADDLTSKELTRVVLEPADEEIPQPSELPPPITELPNLAPEITNTSYRFDPLSEPLAYDIGDTYFFTLVVDDESPLTLKYDADSSDEAIATVSVDDNGIFQVRALSRGEALLWLFAEDDNGLADEFELRVAIE